MKWSEHLIARTLARQTFNRRHLVVVPNCIWTGHECDLLVVTGDLRIIDVEVKISRADLKVDAKKEKWWARKFLGYGERKEIYSDAGRLVRVEQPTLWDDTQREWPPRVWKHYYALPAEIWTDEMLDALPSSKSGVILLRWQPDARTPVIAQVRRRATPNRDAYRLAPAEAVDIARLASLRMWDAYQRLESALA